MADVPVESLGRLTPLEAAGMGIDAGDETHAEDPVLFAIYDSKSTSGRGRAHTEKEVAETGDFVEEGHVLLGQFLGATV